MDGATFTAVVSGAVAVVTATISVGLTYLLTKKREREADWRKLTLENYKAFTAALSGILEGRNISKEALSRFMDAGRLKSRGVSQDSQRSVRVPKRVFIQGFNGNPSAEQRAAERFNALNAPRHQSFIPRKR